MSMSVSKRQRIQDVIFREQLAEYEEQKQRFDEFRKPLNKIANKSKYKLNGYSEHPRNRNRLYGKTIHAVNLSPSSWD